MLQFGTHDPIPPDRAPTAGLTAANPTANPTVARLTDAGKAHRAVPGIHADLVTQALENLVVERQGEGSTGFAIDRLCAALVDGAPGQAQACIDRLLDCGVGVEAVYETYVPRAAARLGELWSDDELSFAAVTLGMARLTEVFRGLSPAFLKNRAPRYNARRALFALVPGESHALGVVMAADHFQRAGWTVRVELRADADLLARIAEAHDFDLLGLSAGSRRMLPDLAATVGKLRRAARPGTSIVVGGQIAVLEPDIADDLGIDQAHATASLALAAVERIF